MQQTQRAGPSRACFPLSAHPSAKWIKGLTSLHMLGHPLASAEGSRQSSFFHMLFCPWPPFGRSQSQPPSPVQFCLSHVCKISPPFPSRQHAVARSSPSLPLPTVFWLLLTVCINALCRPYAGRRGELKEQQLVLELPLC